MKLKKIAIKISLFIFLILYNTSTVLADDEVPDASKEILVTGTVKLAQWGLGIVIALSAAISAFLIAKELIKIQAADDETDTKPHKNRIRSIAIYGVAIILVSGLITTVLGFYK